MRRKGIFYVVVVVVVSVCDAVAGTTTVVPALPIGAL
jgi:hypothetical protein